MTSSFVFSPNIAVNVRRRDDAVKFYRDVLGLQLISQTDHGIEMRAGPITFWFSEGLSDGARPSVGRVFFEFFVEDLNAARATVEKHGCVPEQSTCGNNFEGQMYSDPFGLSFHLYRKKI